MITLTETLAFIAPGVRYRRRLKGRVPASGSASPTTHPKAGRQHPQTEIDR